MEQDNKEVASISWPQALEYFVSKGLLDIDELLQHEFGEEVFDFPIRILNTHVHGYITDDMSNLVWGENQVIDGKTLILYLREDITSRGKNRLIIREKDNAVCAILIGRFKNKEKQNRHELLPSYNFVLFPFETEKPARH